jgi:AcrR family transcriptional regulator
MARPADPNAKIDLLRAAEAVFVAHGLDQAKVEDITARAGRSKGAFYLHFTSKEDAFRQIVETMLARLIDYMHEEDKLGELEGTIPQAELAERRLSCNVEVFEFIWHNRGVMRLLLEGGKSASFVYLMNEFAERTRTQIARGLSRGVGRGTLRPDLDVELTSLAIAGAYDRVARELVMLERKPDLRRWLGAVQHLFLRGVEVGDSRDDRR